MSLYNQVLLFAVCAYHISISMSVQLLFPLSTFSESVFFIFYFFCNKAPFGSPPTNYPVLLYFIYISFFYFFQVQQPPTFLLMPCIYLEFKKKKQERSITAFSNMEKIWSGIESYIFALGSLLKLTRTEKIHLIHCNFLDLRA